MVLKVQNPNNVRVYTVSGDGVSYKLPDWVNKKKAKKDIEFSHRIELIQDFDFPEASNRLKCSRDGNFLMATGVYKPQIKLYEFAEMSLKFERHTDSENVQFEILSDDWTKSVHLQNDRSIEFHSQGGIHYSTRIPRYGRDMKHHYPSCDLYVAAAGDEVYRLNLEQGRFLNPFKIESASAGNINDGVNVMDINPAHQLLAFGTDAGTVEFWDPRDRSRIAILNVSQFAPPSMGDDKASSVTALSFRNDGLNLAVGASNGMSMLFDLRSSNPYTTKDQGYGLPVKNLHWVESPIDSVSRVLSADSKIIKIWEKDHGTPFTSVEPTVDINDVCVFPDSGLIFTANEGSPMHSFYIPALGPAPKWCSFLDNLTEEMEESHAPSIYDNYKFVTKKELLSLGLDHLIGTNVIRPYMHGFFIDVRLYEKARLIANPFSYEEHRQRRVKERLEKQRASKIRAQNKPKVNAALAERLAFQEGKLRKQLGDNTPSVLEDNRFKNVFTDEDFKVDEDTLEYKQLHPTKSTKRLTAAEESEEEAELARGVQFSSDDGLSMDESESEVETFDKLLDKRMQAQNARNKDSVQSIRSTPGGMEMTFSVNRKKKSTESRPESDSGKKKQNYAGRRSASKNVFRQM
ncbi:rRNA processing protein Enp2 [Schizosaccharomyces japonicus yFS275]|uniref:rRNA processing protein Enp2 n=1 Tax=Schizosaccharomyces japonicus (strain yFS275 / FY16936) TaxID=402676 RepID=B6K5Q8_SCHJY|nr:rRNA processing protein Enp2 [Schizosaccharomyces japonicus yFS275]EEB08862.1 rRNA processing protein Enp2 [Schizosaccharomyces japonicus yFS275]